MTDRIRFPDANYRARGDTVAGFNVSKLGDRLPLPSISIGPISTFALPTAAQLGSSSGVIKALLVHAWGFVDGAVMAPVVYNRRAWCDPTKQAPGSTAIHSTLGPVGRLRVQFVFEVEIGAGTTLTVAWDPSTGTVREGGAEVIGFRSSGGP